MDFDEYQKEANKTAIYPVLGAKFVYPTLGLADEAGEVVGKIKKELGDVLWYLAQLSTDLGIKLSEVAKANVEKLASRMERNVLHGSGDNR